MKKLLLSVAILVGATLILSQDKSENIKDVVKDEVVNIQTELQSES
jgi:sensor domain CHASE-containing protein